ncbi:ATP-dependent helicase [Helicobacter bizzozeronii]|uniref:ATP-dependent helicase n=1 Tax=Helicobacter bizzozeronii TaxID=56877 RepID=UPI000CEDD683|nr:UvrD-helicase domain-containing protein [Helicobacter bizzozeronii]
MSIENLLADLNPEQKKAVLHVEGPLLVLAGAGSGKTKTLTTRLTYLLAKVGIPAQNTLTLTFTNKAAREMCQRAMSMLQTCQIKTSQPMLCTFHRFGYLFLKQHMYLLNRDANFKIIKPEEALSLLRPQFLQLKRNSKLEDRAFLGYLLKMIFQIKNHLIALQDCYSHVQSAFEIYTQTLEKENWVDFDDLLALPYAILQHTPSLAYEVSQRYQHLMVDEYQDTNPLQFKLLQLLCSAHDNLCVVGDDDQSIYGFRGADISNILNFPDHFKSARVIKLEQNYRSSKSILACANQLIGHNRQRHGKTLFSHKRKNKHQHLEVLHLANADLENVFIAQKINECFQRGVPYSEIAILYRLNCLSKSVEEGLKVARIPYQIIGGTGFYERAEIKDILAYLRAIADPHDNMSVLRIINKPARGISKDSVEILNNATKPYRLSIYQALEQGFLIPVLSSKVLKALQNFYHLLLDLNTQAQSIQTYADAQAFSTALFERTQIFSTLKDNIEERLENLEEFKGMLLSYFQDDPKPSLQDFLDQSILEPPAPTNQEAIKCMSVHASKGLEFRVVFIVGFEERFFPYANANLEEERRLGYVAITRAKEELYICCVQERVYFGQKQEYLKPSCFLQEAKLLTSPQWQVGDQVFHTHFGVGTIQEITREQEQALVRFGSKNYWLVLSILEKAKDDHV